MGLCAGEEVLDYETAGRPDLSTLPSGHAIQSADHLHWRHHGAWRDGIVVNTNIRSKDVTEIEVIRYGYIFPRMQILKESFELDFTIDTVKRYEYGQYCHPESVVLKRAQKCLKESYTGYNALRNNNEDFCRWCKAGKQSYVLRNEFQLAGVEDKDESEVTEWKEIDSWEDAAHGDHIAWRVAGSSTIWQHGIMMSASVFPENANIVTSRDDKCSMVVLSDRDKEICRVLYIRCHTLNFVLQRAKNFCDSLLKPEDNFTFAKWCKTGVPMNSMMTKIIMPQQEKINVLTQEAAEAASRGGVVSATRGAAGIIVQEASTTVARCALEGATAAAAVGVEAVVVAVEVGMTYTSFSKTRISKDELNRRNIITVVRSSGAVGLGIGGTLAGAAVGSVVPVIGTLVGGIVGGIIGGVSGQVAGHFGGKGIANAAARPYENCCVNFKTNQDT